MADALAAWLDNAAAGEAAWRTLAPRIAAADVVFLGELNHFVHEKSDFRIACAQRLARLGVSAFAEELSWSDGVRIARYLRSGDEVLFDRIALFGFTGDQRTDRDDLPTGIFRASHQAYPHALMRAEQTRFYRALRTLAPSAFFGLDIDGASGGGYGDLPALARTPGETLAQEAARLEAQRGDYAGAECASLEALIDSLRYVALSKDAPSYEALRPAMAFREDCMKRRFAAARALAPGKIAVMAHAMHLAKDDSLIEGGAGVGPGGGQTCSLGHHIVRELGLAAISIWMIYGGGEDSQPMPDLPRRARYPRETLNAQLAQRFKSPSLIATQNAPDAPVSIGHMYNAIFRTRLREQCDALFFFPQVSPMRLT